MVCNGVGLPWWRADFALPTLQGAPRGGIGGHSLGGKRLMQLFWVLVFRTLWADVPRRNSPYLGFLVGGGDQAMDINRQPSVLPANVEAWGQTIGHRCGGQGIRSNSLD